MKLNFMTVIQFFFSALRYYADDELKWLKPEGGEAIKSQRVLVGPIKRGGFLELSVHI